MTKHDAVEGAVTYGIGIGAMSLPFIQEILELGTTLFGLLAAIGGFVLVCIRIRYELQARNKK